MIFAKQLGRKWIASRLHRKGTQQPEAEKMADKVIGFLSNVQEHITHGRLILARELRKIVNRLLRLSNCPSKTLSGSYCGNSIYAVSFS